MHLRWTPAENAHAHFVKAHPWYPSSRLCANCGWKNNDLTLGDRRWHCDRCGALNERDHNAAVDLSNWPGWSFPVSGRGDRVSPATPAVACEASKNARLLPHSGRGEIRVDYQ